MEPIVICGAGLAGLSLACALIEAGEERELVLLDPRASFGADRTWCWWAARPSRFDAAISARWRAWEVVRPDGRRAAHTDARLPYVHARSEDVYALALERLEGRATLRLGTRVAELDVAGRAAVLTDGTRVRGEWLVDARGVEHGPGSGSRAEHAAPAVRLVQAFFGLEVRTGRDVFDPGRATLMDFAGAGPPPPGGLRFVYVLPFARDRALVEDTTFAPGDGPPEAERRAAVHAWLRARGTGYDVLREERGRLPMSDVAHPTVLGDRVVVAGTGAGALRPSSGYAYARIQAHVTALAAAIVADGAAPGRVGSRGSAELDAVFLRALAHDPGRMAGTFAALLAGTTADAFARFMADAASPGDAAQVVLAAADRAVLRAVPAWAAARLRLPG